MKTFKQTSDEPYTRHRYKIVFSDGKSAVFDNYEDVQVLWFQTPSQFLSHVEVLDKSIVQYKGFKE